MPASRWPGPSCTSRNGRMQSRTCNGRPPSTLVTLSLTCFSRVSTSGPVRKRRPDKKKRSRNGYDGTTRQCSKPCSPGNFAEEDDSMRIAASGLWVLTLCLSSSLAICQENNGADRLEWFRDQEIRPVHPLALDSQLGSVISHSLVGASQDYVDRYFAD